MKLININDQVHRLLLQKWISMILTCAFCWTYTYVAVNVYVDYAFGLFIYLPFILGLISTLIYGYKNSIDRKSLRNNAYLALLIYCFGLLFFAWEGIICLFMALPIGVVCTYVGFLLGLAFKKSKPGNSLTIIVFFLFSVPLVMAFEDNNKTTDKIRSVTTSIEIAASPDAVGETVVAFPQIEKPTEFIFKTGIAYPINATIDGQGVGSIRHCNFSTGSFVEPITVWEKPKLLRFSVSEQPEPMKELSFYNIHPNHLHDFWVSKQGQFKLIPLSNGHTLLEGTTWYVNRIKPNFYWSMWSDFIVHKIHSRVLEHIKNHVEAKHP